MKMTDPFSVMKTLASKIGLNNLKQDPVIRKFLQSCKNLSS